MTMRSRWSAVREPENDQRGIRFACDPLDGFLKLGPAVQGIRRQLHAGWQCSFDVRQVCLGDVYRIVNDSNAGGARCDLGEHLHPLGSDRMLVEGKPGRVAARPGQARDITASDRIGNLHEDDWQGAGCLL
jgi:hypothetical protein